MKCLKCEHDWVPVVEKPLKCPACNQPRYWLPKVRNVGGKSEVFGKAGVVRGTPERVTKIRDGDKVSEVGDGESIYEKDEYSQA